MDIRPTPSRRDFFHLTCAGFTLVSVPGLPVDPAAAHGPTTPPWYKTAYRRAVIDMHIPDWDPAFLSQLDVGQYVRLLQKAQAQSIVAYALSHVGLFTYPTKVGQQHRGLKGRDLFKEILDGCHAAGIAVVAYTSLIFDRWAADHHPDWRMRTVQGAPFGQGGRHGLVCPNSPYRDYVRAWVAELCDRYAFEGIRFDMTFWPGVCYCPHCRKRFADEVGGELPQTVDWLNERWVAFQRKREQWLAEFAALATSTARRHRPTASVEHQASTYPGPWTLGVSRALVVQNDFLQGDFYGDALQGSFVRKLLQELTPHQPAGFETSVSVSLQDHTGLKAEPLLEAKAAAALADGTAFIFIDAIDPVGTLNPRVYERMGRIFSRLRPYYGEVGGQRVCDIAVYYSLESKIDFAANGKAVGGPDTTGDAHTPSALAVVRRLIGHHLPFGILTRDGLPRLAEHQVLMLPNVSLMDEAEADAIREWVRAGGCLWASGWTSLVDPRGRLHQDFLLADVFGVTLRRPHWQPWEHYVAPTDAGMALFEPFSKKYPAFVRGIGIEVASRPGARVLATTTLPWPALDPTRFASIHSNPPWVPTDRAEVVFHRYGKGRVVYCASPLEVVDGLDEAFVRLLRQLQDRYTVEADAPACVEVTLFHHVDRWRYVLSLLNFQKDLPNLPVDDIRVRLRLPHPVQAIRLLPGGKRIVHQEREGVVTFVVPRLETLRMFAIEVQAPRSREHG
jgi:hypothetical protein